MSTISEARADDLIEQAYRKGCEEGFEKGEEEGYEKGYEKGSKKGVKTMSNVVSINSAKQVPATVNKTVEPLDESDEAYMGGLGEGFEAGYAAGYRAATSAAGKSAEKTLKTAVIPDGIIGPKHLTQYDPYKLTAGLHELENQGYWLRYSRRRKYAGSTAARREFLAAMNEWMGY